MTYQSAVGFFNKLNGDSVLLNRVSAFQNLDTLLLFASETGFTFTADEWRQVVSGFISGELSEDDLSQVAGGGKTDGFASLGDIRGETIDAHHNQWIEIVSYSTG